MFAIFSAKYSKFLKKSAKKWILKNQTNFLSASKLDWFLAALAAVSLPWSLTHSLTHCFVIVLDSKPSSLPAFQTKPKSCKTDGSHEETWPDQQRQMQRQRQWQWQLYLENTFREQSLILLTFETIDQSDEKTWPNQQKDNVNDNGNENDKYI